MTNNKKIIICIIIFIGLCILFFFFNKQDDSKNLEYAELVSENTSLVINKPIPLDDEVSKDILKKKNINTDSSIYIDFLVKSSKRSHFKILINRKYDSNSISDKYIKVLLLDGNNNKIIKKYDGASYLTLDKLDKFNSSYVLIQDNIGKNKSKHYKLLMWTSDKYVVSSKREYFKGNLSIYSY